VSISRRIQPGRRPSQARARIKAERIQTGISEVRATPALSALSFFIGLTGFVFVQAGGRISIGEVISALVGVIVFFSAKRRPPRFAGAMAGALVVAAVGLAISGSLNSEPVAETGAAMANYAVLTLTAIALGALLIASRGNSLIPLLVGAAFGQLIGIVVTPTESALIDPWKFGVGWAVNILVLVATWHLYRKIERAAPAFVLVLVLAAFNVYQGSRSAGVLVALVAILFALNSRRDRSQRPGLVKLGIVLSVSLFIASLAYEGAAEGGYIGEDAARKLADQSGDYGLLFGARKELIFLVSAYLRSPIFGWGASARVPADQRSAAYDLLANGGYTISYGDYTRLMLAEQLPLHSIALGALVQIGLFALPAIVLFAALCAFAIKAVMTMRLGYAPLLVTLAGCVHLFTSPLGDTTRIQLAIALAIGMYGYSSLRRKQPGTQAHLSNESEATS
jgi:hypothetical protein